MVRLITVEGRRYTYTPVHPRADLAEDGEGKRLIFRHGSVAQGDSALLIAEPNVLFAGWVLGINVMEL